jgi:hypothetical protein
MLMNLDTNRHEAQNTKHMASMQKATTAMQAFAMFSVASPGPAAASSAKPPSKSMACRNAAKKNHSW